MFDEGQPSSDFKGRQITGDFYNEPDLERHGFKLHSSYYRASQKDEMFNEARRLINKGAKVIVNYGMMSIVGDDGSYSLWAKDDNVDARKKATDPDSEL